MPLDEFINCLDAIILQLKSGTVPYNQSIINSLLDNAAIIYRSETDASADYFIDNYRIIAEGNNPEASLAVLNLISGHLKIFSSQKRMYNKRTSDFRSIRCAYSKLLNELKVCKYRANHPDSDDFSDAFTGKGCIYSVITGNYDSVKVPEYVDKNIDYILFTDNKNIQSDAVWQVRYLDNPDGLSEHMLSRHVKVFPYKYLKDYDYSLYIDGNLTITGSIYDLINTYHKKESMLCHSHDERNCIYEEALACEKLGKDTPENIHKQMELLRSEHYPEGNGLIIGGHLLRYHHDKKLKQVMEDWWQMLRSYSKRDQLSFNYVAWKNGYMYDSTDLVFADNRFFSFSGHSC